MFLTPLLPASYGVELNRGPMKLFRVARTYFFAWTAAWHLGSELGPVFGEELPVLLPPVSSADYPKITLGMIKEESKQLTAMAEYYTALAKTPELMARATIEEMRFTRRQKLAPGGNIPRDDLRQSDLLRNKYWLDYQTNELTMVQSIYKANYQRLLVEADGSGKDLRLPLAQNTLNSVKTIRRMNLLALQADELELNLTIRRLEASKTLNKLNYTSGEDVELLNLQQVRLQSSLNGHKKIETELGNNINILERTVAKLLPE